MLLQEQIPQNKIHKKYFQYYLKNWLVTNYTTLMNNIRETLEAKISTKLSHGEYSGTGKALFDLIKSNLSKLENISGTKLDSDKLRVGQCLAGNDTETVLGDTLKFNRPILSAVAIHLGQTASTGIILNSNHTNLGSGIVTFKSTYPYNTAIGCCYIVILG